MSNSGSFPHCKGEGSPYILAMDLSDSFVQPLAAFVEQHQFWAGAVVGGLAFLESLVLIGAFIPATALMLACGGLIAAGILDPVSTIACCVVGAVAGDAVSFFVGQRLAGKKLSPQLMRFRRQVARARFYTRRYGALTIFAGRFFGPLRAFVPTVAGMLKMNPRTFQIANVLSALVWAPLMLAPGYFGVLGFAALEAQEDRLLATLAIALAALVVAGSVSYLVWKRLDLKTKASLARS